MSTRPAVYRRSILWAMSALLLAGASAVQGKDAPEYPKGYSVPTFAGRTFELIVPDGSGVKAPRSLLVLVSPNGRDDLAKGFEEVAQEGFVICAPKSKFLGTKGAGQNWAANEGPELVALVDHLVGVLALEPARTHVVGSHDWAGFLPLVAFAKGSRFHGVCFVDSAYRGGTPPAHAKKEMGVLVYGPLAMESASAEKRIVPALREKVRTAEYRQGEEPPNAYFRYWLRVMDGRFTPGDDLSLPWTDLSEEPAKAKEALAATAGPALVYVYGRDDGAKVEAKAFQNETLFDAEVRVAAEPFRPFKFAREAAPDLAAALGIKATPAVAIVRPPLEVITFLEGKISAGDLRRALEKAAGSKPK